MPETTYTVTTSWKKLKNYNKDGADRLITRISKFDKQIYSKFLNKEHSVIFKGPDQEQALKIKKLLTDIGIYAVVDEKSNSPQKIEKASPSKVKNKRNLTIGIVKNKIVHYTRILLIFPVLLISKLTKKEIPTKNAFIILAIAAFLGTYNFIFDTLMSPFYNLSYSYCTESFVSIETIFIIASIAKNITSISVASLTGISDFISRISGFLENSLIALTAQTVLLKIVQQGFLLKSSLTLGFGLGTFEASRKFGEKIVLFSIFIYIALPFFVATETYIFNKVTTQQIENINAEYIKNGKAVGLSKKAIVGVASYISSKVAEFTSGKPDEQTNENVKSLKAFFMTILNSLMFVLVSTIFLSISGPYVIYQLFKIIFTTAIDRNVHISLFSEDRGHYSMQTTKK